MSDAKTHMAEGVRLRREGDLDAAAARFELVLQDNPDDVAAHNLLGVVAVQKKNLGEARRYFARAAELAPDDHGIRLNLAMALCQDGDLDSSIHELGRLTGPDSGAANLYFTLSREFDAHHRPEDAVRCREKLIEIPATPPRLLHDTVLDAIGQGQHDTATRASERLVEDGFRNAGVYCNYGAALNGAGRTEDALAAFQSAARLDATLYEAPANLGPLYYGLGRYREAIAAFQTALRLRPDDANARARLAHTRLAICDWTDWAESARFFEGLAELDDSGVSPFTAIFWPMAEQDRLKIATRYAERLEREAKHLTAIVATPIRKTTNDKIRIGYMSAGFGDHATAHLTRTMFHHHDRNRFHITGFPMVPDDGSQYRKDIAAGCDSFHDLAGLSDHDAVRRIAAADIDILVDLNGYTRNARPRLLVAPLAPIKVSYLGFPGTMGARFIDYLIGDPIVTPASKAAAFAEKLVLLPHTYQVNDDRQPVADSPSTRAEVGLPDGGVVFATFNSPRKIEPAIFGLWVRILKSVPGSVLWVYRPAPDVEACLRREAEKSGVGPERLVFAPPLPKPQHLARLRLADLFLDTHFYSGHTTASDALSVGLPVLAYPSDSFAGRVAASLLHAIGRPDLIAETADDYVDLAVRLARSPNALAEMRADLLARKGDAPLFDTARFVRNLERAYEEIWRIHRASEEPRQIVIEDGG
ncbi:MAG: tetratricopeptide repeat protein [Alphaproteobacteria bacterium]|nr:tetratricopeptide repeat protein [Alphaproteobacteria bacterium]